MHKIDAGKPYLEYALVNMQTRRLVKGTPKFIAIILTKLFYKYDKERMHITADDVVDMGEVSLFDGKYQLVIHTPKTIEERFAYLVEEID